jgi:hypothetical protein
MQLDGLTLDPEYSCREAERSNKTIRPPKKTAPRILPTCRQECSTGQVNQIGLSFAPIQIEDSE